ncbi:MAG TPA: DUF971 domain-containing protein [Anaerolineales bacterium]|nr:DUF971 domain-containing protein [Anaerolineales bacterium]
MLRPKKVQLNKPEKQLRIEWQEGVLQQIAWSDLRQQCPCAGCRQERDTAANSNLLEMDVFSLKPMVSDQLDAVEPVGNYALRLVWKDGHKTGIYSWEFLKSLATAGDTQTNETPNRN